MSKPNVYTANIDTLQSVPGVGEATIRRIQEMRESGRIITAQNVLETHWTSRNQLGRLMTSKLGRKRVGPQLLRSEGRTLPRRMT